MITWRLFYYHHCFCYYSDCSDGDIRLANGRHSLEGRVEVCYGGVWGTVCSNGWGQADANVVCQQLQNGTLGTIFIGISSITK